MMRLLIITSCALLLAECAFEPNYTRPQSPVPPSFAVNDRSITNDAESSVGWTDIITDQRLRFLVKEALSHNRDLRAASADLNSATAELRLYRAKQLPEIDLSAQADLVQEPLSAVLGGSSTHTVNAHIYSLEASLPAFELDLFGKQVSARHGAAHRRDASAEAVKALEISITAEVCKQWIRLAALERDVALTDQIVDVYDRQLAAQDQTIVFGQAAAVDRLELVRAKQDRESSRASLMNSIRATKNLLSLLVGAEISPNLLPTGEEVGDFIKTEMAPLKSSLLLRRPDVLEAEDTLRAYNADIGVARAEYMPNISLVGTGGLASSALQRLFEIGPGAFYFIPTITAPIFDGGRRRSVVQAAQAQRQAAIAQYEKAIQSAFRDVSDALSERASLLQQMTARSIQANAAMQMEDALLKRRFNGMAGAPSVLAAHQLTLTAQMSLNDLAFMQQINLVKLHAAIADRPS